MLVSRSIFWHNEAMEDLLEQFRVLQRRCEHLENENNLLHEALRRLRARTFGPSSAVLPDAAQLLLFPEAQLPENQAPEQLEDEPESEDSSSSRKKSGRKKLNPELETVDVVVDIPEEDKVCSCGCLKSRIGEETSQKLEYVPARARIIQTIRPKYACKACEGVGAEGPTVSIAPPPPALIGKSIVTPSLMTHVLLSKIVDSIPLYRQEMQLERLGVSLSRGSMANWMITLAEKCKPLLNMLIEMAKKRPAINLDETTIQVMNEKGRKNTSISYMWLLRAGPPLIPRKEKEAEIVVYQYHPTREASFAKDLTSGFRGFVQTDDYAKRSLGVGRAEAMIPRCPELGREAEVDWGEGYIREKGVQKKVHLFQMRSRYSGKTFVELWPAEKQEMFLQAHINAFAFFGGVFPVLVYDNLTTAVKKVLKGRNRVEQEAFKRFRAFYNFEARFCNVASGHEKGGVEGQVGYVRRNYMVPVPEGDLASVNAQMQVQMEKEKDRVFERDGETKSQEVLAAEEKPLFLALPKEPFPVGKSLCAGVNAYQTIVVEKNRYSVGAEWVGRRVEVWVDAEAVVIMGNGRVIARHERCLHQGKWVLELAHYLPTLNKKPGAFDEALPVVQAKKQWDPIFDTWLTTLRQRHGQDEGCRQFIKILNLTEKFSQLAGALKEAAKAGTWHDQAVRMCLEKEGMPSLRFEPLGGDLRKGITDLKLPAPDLNAYDQLLGVGL
jgi:transposase